MRELMGMGVSFLPLYQPHACITVLPAFYTNRLSVLMEEGKSYKIPEVESYQI